MPGPEPARDSAGCEVIESVGVIPTHAGYMDALGETWNLECGVTVRNTVL